VTVSSRPGRTTFTVWLPLAAPSVAPVSPFAPPVSP
jgi:hypothetical protein